MSRLMQPIVDLEKMSSEDLINLIKNDSIYKECCVVIMEKHLNIKDLLNLKEFQMVRWGYSKAIIEKMMILIAQMREKTRIMDKELYHGYLKMQPNVISKKLDSSCLTSEAIKSEPRNVIKNLKCLPKPYIQREKEGNKIEESNQCGKIISPRKDSSEDYYDGMGYLNPRKFNVSNTNSSERCQRFNTDPFKKTKTGSSGIAGRKPQAPPRDYVAQEHNVYKDPHSLITVIPDFSENDYESVSSMQENSVKEITHDTEIYAEPDDEWVRDDLENLGGQDIDPTNLPKNIIRYTNLETSRFCCYSHPTDLNALEPSLNKLKQNSALYPSINNNNKEQSTFVNQNATSWTSTESNLSKIKNIKGNSKNSLHKPSHFKSFSDRPLPPLPVENMHFVYSDTENVYSDPSHMTTVDATDKTKEYNKGPEEEFASYGNITVQEQTRIPLSGYDGATTKNPNLEKEMQFPALLPRTLQENEIDRSRKNIEEHALVEAEEELVEYENDNTKEAYRKVQEQTRIPLSGDGVTIKTPNLMTKKPFLTLLQRTLQDKNLTNETNKRTNMEHALVRTEKELVDHKNETTKDTSIKVQEQIRIPLSGNALTTKTPYLEKKMYFPALPQRTLLENEVIIDRSRKNVEHALVEAEEGFVEYKNENTKEAYRKVQEQSSLNLSEEGLTIKTSKLPFLALLQRTLQDKELLNERNRSNTEHALVRTEKELVDYKNEHLKGGSRKVEESTKTMSLGRGISNKPLGIETKIVTLQRTLQDKEVINDTSRSKEEQMLMEAEEEPVEYENENTKDAFRKVTEPNKMSHLGVTTKTQSLEAKNNFATVLQRTLQDKEVKNNRSRRSKEEHMLVEAEEEPVEYENEDTKDAYRKVKQPNKMSCFGVATKTQSLDRKNNFPTVLQRTLQDKEVKNDRTWTKAEHALLVKEKESVEFKNENTKEIFKKGPSSQIKVDIKQNFNSKPIVYKLDDKLASNLKEALLNKKKELASTKNSQEEHNSKEINIRSNIRLTSIKLPKPPTSILVPIHCLEPAIQPVSNKIIDDEEYVEFLANINDHEFYRNTDRKGAKQLLRDLDNGAFVFRPSNMYFLSITVKSNEKYFHVGINKDPHTKKLYIGEDKFATPEFSSLHELTTYYEANPLIVKIGEHIQDVFLKKLLTRDNY